VKLRERHSRELTRTQAGAARAEHEAHTCHSVRRRRETHIRRALGRLRGQLGRDSTSGRRLDQCLAVNGGALATAALARHRLVRSPPWIHAAPGTPTHQRATPRPKQCLGPTPCRVPSRRQITHVGMARGSSSGGPQGTATPHPGGATVKDAGTVQSEHPPPPRAEAHKPFLAPGRSSAVEHHIRSRSTPVEAPQPTNWAPSTAGWQTFRVGRVRADPTTRA